MNNSTCSFFTSSKKAFKNYVVLCGLLMSSSLSFGQIFNQNFTSSTTLSDYVSTTPNNGQFNAISTSGAGTVISINTTGGNKLRFARTGNAGTYSRTTDFSPVPTSMIYKFDLTVSGNNAAQTTAAVWQVGDGFGTANSSETNANTHSRIGLNLTATNGQFSIRDLGASNNTTNFTGTQSITWVINNSGATLSYTAPDGTTESVANDRFDLWIGSTKAFDERSAETATKTLSDLKFAFSTGNATIDIDNINITTISSAITSTASGNWSNTATWSGGVVPTSADNAVIAGGHVVVMDSGTFATRNSGTTTTVNAGGTLATSQTYINNGTTTINGSFQLNSGGWVSDAGGTNPLVYGTNGTLIFNATYGANNGNYWPTTNGPVNVTVNTGSVLTLGFNRTVTGTFQTASGVTLGASVLTLNGICQLNGGGFFNNAPTYGAASTLVYNTSYGVYNEWTGNGAAGVGIPANVRVQSGTLSMPTTNRGIPGNITIDATCSLALNGTSGDLFIGGNWTNAGAFTANGRAVFFNGAANQTITNTAGETFSYLINNKTAGNLILANNVTVNATAGSVLQILNAGAIDLNGRTLTLANNGGDLQVTGGARSITSSVAGGILSITGSKTVTSTSSGTLTLGANVSTSLTNGINFGASLSTVQGRLIVNGGGFVNTNAPVYANTSTLEYNGVTGYGVNNEWTGNATTAGVGTPQNVTLTSSSVNLPNTARSLAGNLIIATGSTLNLNGAIGADLSIGGNWTNSGTFNPNSRQVIFRGALAQTLTGATTFDFLRINNTAGLTLNNAVTNNLTLDLTAGNITLGTNNLTIGATGTIINAGATSYVRTNSTGQLRRTVGSTATLFAIGNAAYNPITFNNSGTADVYGVRVADGAITTGLTNTKTVSRRWITTEAIAGGSNLSVVAQYNFGEENTNFIAGTNPKIGFYNGSTWTEVFALPAGSNPYTFTSVANSAPADLTSGTQYFALGKDNAFFTTASQYVITAISPAAPGAGYPFNVTVQAQDAFGVATNVTANSTFTLSTNGNAGAIGGTVSGTIVSGTNSIVVTGVTLASAGTGATLTATNTAGLSLTSGTSAAFNVLSAATQLEFVGVPATGNVGVNLSSFTVRALRPDNSVDTFYTTDIVLTKASGSGNLTGTLSVTPVNGVATFNAAQFDAAATYTLYADSGIFSQITSGNIVVTLVPVTLAAWDFFGVLSGTPPVTFTATTFNSNLDSSSSLSDITRGPSANPSGANNSFRTQGFENNGISVSNADYFQTTLKTDLGYSLNLSNLRAIYNGTTSFFASPGVTSQYAYSFDGINFTLIGSPVTSTSVLTVQSVDLSSVSALQNIPSETTVYIRYYASGQTTTGGWGYNSSAAGTNGLEFRGNVLCVEPIAYTVTGGGAICVGSAGIPIGLSNSQVGIIYQLIINGSNAGSPVAGTGSAISFGNQNTIGTYTVEALNSACSLTLPMTGSVSISAGATTTWSGSPASWDNGAPTSAMIAIISADYSEVADINACSLTVNNNAIVTIPSGNVISLFGGLTVESGSSFVLNSDAVLLQDGTTNQNSGNITVNRSSQDLMRLDYTMWSSPVEGQVLAAFSPLTMANRFYTYSSFDNFYTPIANTNSFTVGQGYLIRMPDNHPTSPTAWNGAFIGKPNSGTITIGLSTAGTGFNAVGNPYPSPISIATFLSENSSVIGSDLYFWRKTNGAAGSAYITFSGGSFSDGPHANNTIQPGQGFIVQATNAADLTFTNTQRNANNGVFYRNGNATESEDSSRIWLNLKSNEIIVGQMAVGYRAEATNSIDADFDAVYINDSDLALNSFVEGTELAVQHRATFTASDVVPLSFKTTTSGTYAIAINDVDGLFTNADQNIYLKDNLLNVEHDLRSAPYSFVSEIGVFANRFEIVYQSALSVEVPTFGNGVVVYSKNKTIEINSGNEMMSSVKVFDIRGRIVAEKVAVNSTNTSINLISVANQVLIIQITAENGQTVSRKVVH